MLTLSTSIVIAICCVQMVTATLPLKEILPDCPTEKMECSYFNTTYCSHSPGQRFIHVADRRYSDYMKRRNDSGAAMKYLGPIRKRELVRLYPTQIQRFASM
ncbi:hypothetical protein EJ08DRAFT_162556 [Tothia fuscella]|uniref:Uncharacterized protein n=1 Tax=Tothia fuscella TaxID=1048955 RepID=A0A9P4NUS1_9PEZI|nr:hypothetical protein EJ08DRAFT_162556 [Tothia fuscella]